MLSLASTFPSLKGLIFISAETGCIYFEEIVFPDKITAGIKIKHLGNSSVQYDIGLFKNNNETTSAIGHFVHVLVDKKNRRPIKLPEKFIKALVRGLLLREWNGIYHYFLKVDSCR